jgi:hypothetical protein
VDSDGNEQINAGDCTFGLGQTVDAGLGDPTDGADILGNTQANTNPCGFANPPSAANNGLVDLNGTAGGLRVSRDGPRKSYLLTFALFDLR